MKKKYVVAFFLGFGLVFVLPFVGTINGEDFLETDFTVEGYVCEFATKNKIHLDNTVFSPSGDNCTQEVMDFAQKTSCATEYENMDWAIGKKRKAKLRAEYLECVFSLKEKLVSKVDSLLEEQRKRKAEEAAQAERERLEKIAREERLKKEEEERIAAYAKAEAEREAAERKERGYTDIRGKNLGKAGTNSSEVDKWYEKIGGHLHSLFSVYNYVDVSGDKSGYYRYYDILLKHLSDKSYDWRDGYGEIVIYKFEDKKGNVYYFKLRQGVFYRCPFDDPMYCIPKSETGW